MGARSIENNVATIDSICYISILMREPLETAELLAFTRTVDAKSLSRAAAELGVPRATISRRLARLEERLGARLLRRSTRSLVLTDAGEALYRHGRIVLDAVASAEASVRRTDEAVRGDLRVSVPPISDPNFFAMLCDFSAQYPEVRLQVHFSTQVVDLKRDGYDVALRAGIQLQPGLIARTLRRDPVHAVASPEYIAKRGMPRSAKELRNHVCLLGFARGELPDSYWPLKDGGRLQVEGTLVSNEITLLCAAAVRGLGIAFLPQVLTRPWLEQGRLVPVLPGVVEADSQVAVVYLEREFVPPQVRAFVAALVAWAQTQLAELSATNRRCAERSGRRGARGKTQANKGR
jgi:DNA-binding transcriptional LysR family regulator